MKVGTDGVLLGAWASPPISEGGLYLDVGTGTGLIALMLAQRFLMAKIEGIDIDDASIKQAKENVKESVFCQQIEVRKQDFLNLDSFSRKYDLIVSNPPFYVEDTLGGKEARDIARHSTFLPFEKLVSNAAFLLKEGGHFSVIIPHKSASELISLCAQNGLYLTRRMDIRSTEKKPFKRTLLEFSTSIQSTVTSILTLYDQQQNRTYEYAELTSEFYL